MVLKFHVEFQHVPFLASQDTFAPHFLETVVEGQLLGQPHILRLFGGRQGHALYKLLSFQLILFVSGEVQCYHKTAMKVR